jgi:formiminotetrahydrofolate cyclodeaminase
MSTTTGGVELADVTMGRLHDVLAEPGPGPAGGSAAALATTMAAGLVRLVARVSREWEDAPGIAAQAAALGDRSLLLADDDHRVYAHALAQLDAPDRDASLGKALREAARVPLEIAETAADVAALAALSAREGAETVRGDAWAAAVLAEAASVAAAGLVRVNLATRPDDDLCARAELATRAAAAARDVALAAT